MNGQIETQNSDSDSDFQESSPSIFISSWRSELGLLLILYILAGMGFAIAAIVQPGVAASWLYGGAAVFFAALSWWGGRYIWRSGAYLQFNSSGIDGMALRGKKISWHDVADISLLTMTENSVHLCVNLHLQPGQ